MPISAWLAVASSGILIELTAASLTFILTPRDHVWVISAQSISPVRDHFKMIWIYAAAKPAKMIKLFSKGDAAFKKFIANSMRVRIFTISINSAVPIFSKLISPYPAPTCRAECYFT
jgi:hypothetical protein